MQLYRKGHQSKNAKTRRKIERGQRAAAKLWLAGKKKAKKVKAEKDAKQPRAVKSQAYPCSAKQMALGDMPTPRSTPGG